MRDVTAKSPTLRTARAVATVSASAESIRRTMTGELPKGEALSVLRTTAMMGAKLTPTLIPYCHPIPIEHMVIEFDARETELDIVVMVRTVAKTGVEMEALSAAAVAALNLVDLLKPIDQNLEIRSIRLLEKQGGKTDFKLPETAEISAGVIVCSDRVASGERNDRSGQVLAAGLRSHGVPVSEPVVVADDPQEILQALQKFVTPPARDIVLISGGTGVGPRDVTFETLLPILDKRLPGIEHRYLEHSLPRVPTAMLGRPLAGIVGQTLVIAVPGSVGAAQDTIDSLFPFVLHALPMLHGEPHD